MFCLFKINFKFQLFWIFYSEIFKIRDLKKIRVQSVIQITAISDFCHLFYIRHYEFKNSHINYIVAISDLAAILNFSENRNKPRIFSCPKYTYCQIFQPNQPWVIMLQTDTQYSLSITHRDILFYVYRFIGFSWQVSCQVTDRTGIRVWKY